jgi:hypothetical protein
MAEFEAILGQPCKASWKFKDPGQGYDYMVAMWAQTAKSPPIATGTLLLPTGPRSFRIVCDQTTAVIHPDDSGWVVRAVEPLMRIKPIWAQPQLNRVLPGNVNVPAGFFPWLPIQWTCPECWPQTNSTACNEACTVTKIYGGRHEGRIALYGYDNRAMRPWASNIDLVPQCGKGFPGGPNSLCMPVEGFCGFNPAKDYIQAFWQDAARAVAEYNAKPAAPRETTPKTAVATTPIKPTPKRDVNWLPLLAVGLGTGLASVFLWNLRR